MAKLPKVVISEPESGKTKGRQQARDRQARSGTLLRAGGNEGLLLPVSMLCFSPP